MNEFQQFGYGQPSIAPQSLFGGMFGAPVGSAIGRGIGGLFGNPNLGSRIGVAAGEGFFTKEPVGLVGLEGLAG